MEDDSGSVLTGVGSVVPSNASGQGLFSVSGSDDLAARLDEVVRDTHGDVGSHADVSNANVSETVGTVDFEHAISASWNSLSSDSVEPVWNSGFWRCIFGGHSLGESLEQSLKRPMPIGEVGSTEELFEETGKKQMVMVRSKESYNSMFQQVHFVSDVSRVLTTCPGKSEGRRSCRRRSSIGWY